MMRKKAVMQVLCNDKNNQLRTKISHKLLKSGFTPPFNLIRVGCFNRQELGIIDGDINDWHFAHVPDDNNKMKVYALDANNGKVSLHRRLFANKEVANKFVEEISELMLLGASLDKSKWQLVKK